MALKQVVGELIYKITGDSKGLGVSIAKADAQVKKLGKSMDKTEKNTTKLKKGFLSVGTAVKGFIAGFAARGLFGLAKAGAQLDSLTQSFTRLSSELGISGDEALGTLKEFSAGTIANTNLIQSANRAMVLGVAESTEEFGELMQIARLRARDLGLTTTQAFDDIVTGIGRGSPLILDNLGIVIRQQEAYDRYAASLGKTSQALSENEKREALKFAVLEDGRRQIEQVGELQVTYNERLQQASTFVVNLRDNIGRALLPAMASLLDATLDGKEAFFQTTEEINKLGKAFFRAGQAIIGVFNSIQLAGRGLLGLMQLFQTGILATANAGFSALSKIKGAFGGNTDDIDNEIDIIKQNLSTLTSDLDQNGAKIQESLDKVRDSFSQAFDPTEYQGISDGQLAEIVNQSAQSISTVGDAAEDSNEELEKFQEQMLGVIDKSKQAQTELGDKLTDTFATFGASLKQNAEATVKGLAEITLGAEKAIDDLKSQLRDTDDRDRRKEIKDEIKKQEEILKARKDFEEREAERVLEIRKKLEEAGIDAAQAGLESLIETKDLEAQIEEQRRIADLDAFTRFEEEQVRRQEALVDALIQEVALITDKIEKQKMLEAETTAFLLAQNAVRSASVKEFADQAIAKYGEMASELRRAISLQQQLNALRSNPRQFHEGGHVGADGGEVHAGEYVIPANMVSRMGGLVSALESQRRGGGDVVNNRNVSVNAPITATLSDTIDVNTIGREFAWELNRL